MYSVQSFYDMIGVSMEADASVIDRRTAELLDRLQQAGWCARLLAALRGEGISQVKSMRDALLDSERRQAYDRHWEHVKQPTAFSYPWL